MCLNLDLLAEKRKLTLRIVVEYQQRVARYYNQNVRVRQFKIGDWVPKKVNQSTKYLNDRVFGLNWEGRYRVLRAIGPRAYKLAYADGREVKRSWNAEHLKKYFQ